VLAYLCAARPLLVSMPSDNLAARVVERSGGGILVPPHDAPALWAGAEALLDDEPRRSELSRRARDYAEATFDLERIASRFEELLERVTR
jgi:glycosyltransferase involved in cell wall biosynthesis